MVRLMRSFLRPEEMGNCVKRGVRKPLPGQEGPQKDRAPNGSIPEVLMEESAPVDMQQYNMDHMRRTFEEDINAFLLNNLLLTVQFFKNYQRELEHARKTRVQREAELNKKLADYKKECILVDKLHEAAGKNVIYKTSHGERKGQAEYLHSQRMIIVPHNVEVHQSASNTEYSEVDGPKDQLAVEYTKKSGFIKLKCLDSKTNTKRNGTYETLDTTDDEYSRFSDYENKAPTSTRKKILKLHIPSTSDGKEYHSDSSESPPQMTPAPHLSSKEFFPGTSSMKITGQLLPQTLGNPRQRSKVFGPQSPDKELPSALTPTERRLSGILKEEDFYSMGTQPRIINLASQKGGYKKQINGMRVNPSNVAVIITEENRYSNRSESIYSGTSGYNTGSPNYLKSPESIYGSTSESEYGYAKIKSLTEPKPLQQRCLGRSPFKEARIPKQCYKTITIPLVTEEDNSSVYSPAQLFEDHKYLSSNFFMGYFGDEFQELAHPLGFTESVGSAVSIDPVIYCEHVQNGCLLTDEAISAIKIPFWPDHAIEWLLRPRNKFYDKRTKDYYVWPSAKSVQFVKSLGCFALPVGFLPPHGKNKHRDIEWTLAFPTAERYLESTLLHSHVRLYMFVMAIYKAFLSSMGGLTPQHLRTILFWRVEENFRHWPEEQLGERLRTFLEKTYECLRSGKLPNYFISKQNLFLSTPQNRLSRVQEKLLRVRENLTMHVLIALKNLNFNEDFYPVFDYNELYKLLTQKSNVDFFNPNLTKKEEENSSDGDDDNTDIGSDADSDESGFWGDILRRNRDPKREWHRKVRKTIEAEKAQKAKQEERKKSVETIDVKINVKKIPFYRRERILEMFITHFIEMALRSNKYRDYKQGLMYLTHAENLTILLQEIGGESYKVQGFLRKITSGKQVCAGATEPENDTYTSNTLRNSNWQLLEKKNVPLPKPPEDLRDISQSNKFPTSGIEKTLTSIQSTNNSYQLNQYDNMSDNVSYQDLIVPVEVHHNGLSPDGTSSDDEDTRL